MAISYVFHHNSGGQNYYDYYDGAYNKTARLYNGQLFFVPEALDSQGGDIGARVYYYKYTTSSVDAVTFWQFDTIHIPNGASFGNGKIYRLSTFNCSCYGMCSHGGSYYNTRRMWGHVSDPPYGTVTEKSTAYQPLFAGTIAGVTETDQATINNLNWLRMWGYRVKSSGNIVETHGQWAFNDIRLKPDLYTINTY